MSQSGGSTTHRFDVRDGGILKEEVTLRKRSENRHYTDGDGVRDSIVMGNLSGGFLDNLGIVHSVNQIRYNASQGAAFGKNPWLTPASTLLIFFSFLCRLSVLYTFFLSLISRHATAACQPFPATPCRTPPRRGLAVSQGSLASARAQLPATA